MNGNFNIMKNKIQSPAESLRLKAEELLQRKPAKSVSQPSEADALKAMHELEVYQIELELQQEELIWAENQAKELGIKAAIGKGDQSLKSKTNVNDRKRAAKALAVSEIRYRRLFESSMDGILILDAETGKIKDVNPFLIGLLGYSREQWIEKEIWEIGFFRDIAANREKFIELQQKQYLRYEDLQLETAQGRKINVEFISNIYFVDKKRVIQCNIRDITARKQVEAEIKLKNEELLKTTLAKDKFFSIIAHDLRNPFNGFLGLTELMVKTLPTMSLEEIQKFTLVLRNSATQLFRLLENLLEWSSLQRGLIAFVPATFLLLPKVSESMVIVQEAADKKEILISYEIPDDMSVFADRNMLGSIIRNLATNAVKFTSKGGSITVSATPTYGNALKIAVRDTGIGMNKSIIDHLFSPDFNTSRKGTEGESSTGLGLVICKDLIEKHGGQLWVESEEGKGSVFSFTIPSKVGTE